MTNIRLYDLSRKLYLMKIPLLPRIISRTVRILYGCEIPYTADIDKSVKFIHKGLGVVIGHDVKIGKNVKILQNVTIGGKSGIRGNPIIEENVLIGAGACILGPIIIEKNSKIGAQAVVLNDIPENSIAVGIPAKIK